MNELDLSKLEKILEYQVIHGEDYSKYTHEEKVEYARLVKDAMPTDS